MPTTPMQRQRAAQRKHGYGPITLRREGDFAVVEIERGGIGGQQVEVIREHVDGPFSHSITPLGIAEILEGREI